MSGLGRDEYGGDFTGLPPDEPSISFRGRVANGVARLAVRVGMLADRMEEAADALYGLANRIDREAVELETYGYAMTPEELSRRSGS